MKRNRIKRGDEPEEIVLVTVQADKKNDGELVRTSTEKEKLPWATRVTETLSSYLIAQTKQTKFLISKYTRLTTQIELGRQTKACVETLWNYT